VSERTTRQERAIANEQNRTYTQIANASERANEVRSALARREYEVRQEITSEAWNGENNYVECNMSATNME
jgi:hypothetical protein